MDIVEQLKRLQAGKLGPYPDREIWSQAIAEIERLRDFIQSLDNMTVCFRGANNTFIDNGIIVAADIIGVHEQRESGE